MHFYIKRISGYVAELNPQQYYWFFVPKEFLLTLIFFSGTT